MHKETGCSRAFTHLSKLLLKTAYAASMSGQKSDLDRCQVKWLAMLTDAFPTT